jgi:glycosyltransferase involved in cell wall biosynthesis
MSLSEKPLISFVVLSYNHSDFISESLNGALNQNYPKLEIIISDDNSSDNTHVLIQDIVAKYNGPHKVKYFFNKKNLGIAEHLNKVLRLCEGEIIVISAGDDISLQNRSTDAYNILKNSEYTAVFTNLLKIDQNSNQHGEYFSKKPIFASALDEYFRGLPCWTIGASLSFKRNVFDDFMPLPNNVKQEDGCFAFRAIMLGKLVYDEKIQVLYRSHPGSVSQHVDPKKRLHLQRSIYFMHRSNYRDALHKCLDKKYLSKMRIQLFFYKMQHYFFSIPFFAHAYNYLRIKLKQFLVNFHGK